ncbi:hypothetical protein BDU57DRAFT_560331 [Ampelomyces quisqualis]|uniref:Uncharacterized protein n=1 Tax=Ampelomyces quisqualis TaxID=50730 RepID=A0A6A5QBD1_AMPQU|nr:hypothetical protein BDU57DRAFT_560331 [Ampelomyces quisqualis]
MSDAAFFAMPPIQHLIEESSLTSAPGLADMIRSPGAPSAQQLRAYSVPLSRDDLTLKWIVYLQYYRKGPLWAIYCGKTTNARCSQERLMDYEYERSNIPDSIKDLLERALEATFATGFWANSEPTLGSVTPLRFWEEVPWLGLCSDSSLMETTFAGLEDGLPNLDKLHLAWKERAELATKKYRISEKGQASLDKRKDELKEAYRTDEEFREI